GTRSGGRPRNAWSRPRTVVELSIPDPSLVVLIGSAGAGKSTFAARHFDPSEVFSSDAYRAQISGDPANQAVTRAAFGRLHRDLARRLEAQQLTVVDATNLRRAARRVLLRLAAAGGVPAIAIVFDLPVHVILARNAARTTRVVDEAVVHRHLAQVRAIIDGRETDLDAEGFGLVTIVRDPGELDGITVVRR
ncbi:MAG: AAA family ATPase, partial [Candidatus Limnocylindrales bacterium]